MPLPETIFQDLRYASRIFHRNAGVTAVAVLALALGIGINATVFTAYKALVTRPLDARNPGEMVNLAVVRQSGVTDPSFSYPDYEAYRDRLQSFRGVITQSIEHPALSGAGGIVSQRRSLGESLFGRLGLTPPGASNAEFAMTLVVSENYFSVLGSTPLRGRTFDSIGVPALRASPAVLISENYWQKRFAADPAVVGKSIRLNGAAFTIAGITPHDFVGTFVGAPDFWLPVSLEPLIHPGANWLADRENECCRLFARLDPGVTIGQAQAEMTLLADRLRSFHDSRSESSKPLTALVWPGSPFPLPIEQYGGLRLAILLIIVAAGMVLAVACVNVAGLQLARARTRQAELGMRLSLGASRLRVIRQLLTESALLGLFAGAAALPSTWVLAHVLATRFAEAVPPEDGTMVFHVTPDAGILAYVLVVSLVAGVLFGLAPALESSRSSLFTAFKANSGTSTARSRRLRDSLVALQVAVSLVLMITASMFLRSAIRSLRMETGYDSKHVIDLKLQFPEGPEYTAGRKLAIVRELRTRLGALPGVAALTSARSPEDGDIRSAVLVSGEKSAQAMRSTLHFTYIQATYLDTLGIPLLLGRGFTSQAGEDEHSVILSESAARQLWPGQNPVGRSLRADAMGGAPWQVVGVARDRRGVETFDGSDSRQAYLPLPDGWLADNPILIRAKSGPAPVMRLIDATAASVDPGLVTTYATLEDMLRLTPPFIASSLSATVASALGVLGLLLAVMGIYGTVSYIVVLRTREVGIRMAIGAQARDTLLLILRESIRPVIAGLLLGVLLAAAASYLLRSLFYGLNGIDGISFAGVAMLFLVIALAAAYPPCRRAMRVDPMVALRYE